MASRLNAIQIHENHVNKRIYLYVCMYPKWLHTLQQQGDRAQHKKDSKTVLMPPTSNHVPGYILEDWTRRWVAQLRSVLLVNRWELAGVSCTITMSSSGYHLVVSPILSPCDAGWNTSCVSEKAWLATDILSASLSQKNARCRESSTCSKSGWNLHAWTEHTLFRLTYIVRFILRMRICGILAWVFTLVRLIPHGVLKLAQSMVICSQSIIHNIRQRTTLIFTIIITNELNHNSGRHEIDSSDASHFRKGMNYADHLWLCWAFCLAQEISGHGSGAPR